MKKTFILLFTCQQLFAQLSPNTATKFLDKNKVKAAINTVNNKFWNVFGNGAPSYEVPKGRGTHAMFGNSIWIGGLDHLGQLHLAGNTYRQNGSDFWPGPLDTTNIQSFSSLNSTTYNKLWKVDCNDITNFVNAYNNGSVTANTYTVPVDILSYPAIGISNFQKHLSPFYDANSNGLYNPQAEGDYPLIKGHQQILSIYNDNNGVHGETGASKMGIEIQERSYAYSEPNIHDSMQAINYTTFYHYTIINRSENAYNNVYLTDWSDVDVGYYLNDYIGTDSINDFGYCYNYGTLDPTNNFGTGYGNKLPVLSHALIHTNCTSDGIDNNNNGIIDEPGEQFKLDKTTYYNNNVAGFPISTTNPGNSTDYYNYMKGNWKNNTPFSWGGNGFGGLVPTSFVYTGNPEINSGWTESTAGNVAGDRRILLSSGPFNFPPGTKIEWGYAIVFSQDTTMAINSILQFDKRVRRDVKNIRYYDDTHQNVQCAPTVTFVSTVGINEKENANLNAIIYPNPAKDVVSIDLSENVSKANAILFDLSGRKIMDTEITNSYRLKLDVSALEKGIYIVEVHSAKKVLREKIVKN